MITYKLRVRGKYQLVGVYAPHGGLDILVNTLLGWGDHLQFDSTAKGMLTTMFLQMGYNLPEIYKMLNDDEPIEIFGVTPKEVLATLVGQMRQNVAPDFWLKPLESQLSYSKRRKAFVTGMVYPNEYHWIKWQHGYTIAIVNPTIPTTNRLDSYIFDKVIVDEGTDYEFKQVCKQVKADIIAHFSN